MTNQDASDQVAEANADDKGDINADQIREDNRNNERSPFQHVADGIDSVLSTFKNGKQDEKDETSNVLEALSEAEKTLAEDRRQLLDDAAVLSADAGRRKRALEEQAVKEDHAIAWNQEEVDGHREEYETRFHGTGTEDNYGMIDTLATAGVLGDTVGNMRNVEDDSYTHVEKDGISLPFIKEANRLDGNGDQWLGFFQEEREKGSEALSEFVGAFNLDERKTSYDRAVEGYEASKIVEEKAKDLAEEAEVELDDINEHLGDEYGEIQDENWEEFTESARKVAADLNMKDVEDTVLHISKEDEIENAIELSRQLRARALDRVQMHKDALDDATEQIDQVDEYLSDVKSDLGNFVEEARDLTRIEGVGENTAKKLRKMKDVDTVMDVALLNETAMRTNPNLMTHMNKNGVPSATEVIRGAYEDSNELASEYGQELGMTSPFEAIQHVGEDASGEDQTIYQMQGTYLTAFNLVNGLEDLESELPDTDQYDPDWEGEYDSLEEERSQVYGLLGVESPSEPKEALGYDTIKEELENGE